MKLLLNRLRSEWPAWLAVSFFALLPFRRLAEIPLSIFALSLFYLLGKAAYLVWRCARCKFNTGDDDSAFRLRKKLKFNLAKYDQ